MTNCIEAKMILEVAILDVVPGKEKEFEEAFSLAQETAVSSGRTFKFYALIRRTARPGIRSEQ
jgi:hypothetical protein